LLRRLVVGRDLVPDARTRPGTGRADATRRATNAAANAVAVMAPA
jgi:hypothetical protein